MKLWLLVLLGVFLAPSPAQGSIKIEALKKILTDLGQPVDGTKSRLLVRLETALAATGPKETLQKVLRNLGLSDSGSS